MYEGILSPLTLLFLFYVCFSYGFLFIFLISSILETLTSFEKLGSKLCSAYNKIPTWSILNNSIFMIWWKHSCYCLNALLYTWSSYMQLLSIWYLKRRSVRNILQFFHLHSRYFGVDISAIQDYAKACGDIQHLRARIRLVIANPRFITCKTRTNKQLEKESVNIYLPFASKLVYIAKNEIK